MRLDNSNGKRIYEMFVKGQFDGYFLRDFNSKIIPYVKLRRYLLGRVDREQFQFFNSPLQEFIYPIYSRIGVTYDNNTLYPILIPEELNFKLFRGD